MPKSKPSRKVRKGRKNRKGSKKNSRRNQRGGTLYSLSDAAAVNYSLADSQTARQSLAQGMDYERYHAAQHGGNAPYPMALSGQPLLDPAASSSALMNPLTKAYADIAGLSDPQPTPIPSLADGGVPMEAKIPLMGVSPQSGGRNKRRRNGRKTNKKNRKNKNRKNRKNSRKNQKNRKNRNQRGGGDLGYAPVTAPGLLLDSQAAYSRAGLNPDYYTGSSTEQIMADARDRA